MVLELLMADQESEVVRYPMWPFGDSIERISFEVLIDQVKPGDHAVAIFESGARWEIEIHSIAPTGEIGFSFIGRTLSMTVGRTEDADG